MTDPTPDTGDTGEESTGLDELNDQGVGGTIGDKDSFEPEESEGAPESPQG